MKELSTEEKAKAYDEALKVANKYKDTHIMFPSIKDEIFPELKESEDEKVRKKLINIVKKSYEQGGYALHKWEADEMLAWLEKQGEQIDIANKEYWRGYREGKKEILDKYAELEKQGEQKPIWHNEDEEPQRGRLILLIMQNGTPIVAKIIEPNHTFNHGERWAYIDDLLEKQGKGKLTDKPKFKVGDWITNGKLLVGQVTSFNGEYYHYMCDGLEQPLHVSSAYRWHIWTIQDAKAGDVLAWDDSKCIALFKNTYDKDSFNSYGFVGHCTGAFESRQSYHDIKGAHPATKEQRDFLFQKIKEAGNEWDADKKKLKKGEQKSIKTCAEYYNNGRELKMPIDKDANLIKGCGIEFPYFGASYPDARCCDGYLWDMDSWDESLGGMTVGGDDPCPVCNTDKWLERVMENKEFETEEDALDYVKHLKEKYL